MPQLLIYLLNASICLNVFYLVYVLLFRNTTFFQRNRLYLLFSIIASFIIPAITIDVPAATNHLPEQFLQPVREAADISHYDSEDIMASTISRGASLLSILSYIYLAGLVTLTLTRLRAVGFLFRIRGGQLEYTSEGCRIVRTSFGFPFSFGNTIYLPPGVDDRMIVEHEKSHIKQRHWIDLVLVELAVVVMWFNPVILLLRRSIKTLHEFQADEHAISACDDLPAYLSCLMQQVRTKDTGLISPFFSNTFKQRIHMMTKRRTSRIFSAVYLLVLPVLTVLLGAFSLRDPVPSNADRLSPQRTLKVIIDPAHGGNDPGATAPDGTYEKDITLAVAREIVRAATESGIQVTLTRDTDAALALAERTAFSSRHKADVFVSLHADNSPDHPERRGSRVMISRTGASESSQRLGNCVLNGMKEMPGSIAGSLEQGDPFVLKNNTVPAVIVELGFLSNNEDATRLTDPALRRDLAASIVKGLSQYRAD